MLKISGVWCLLLTVLVAGCEGDQSKSSVSDEGAQPEQYVLEVSSLTFDSETKKLKISFSSVKEQSQICALIPSDLSLIAADTDSVLSLNRNGEISLKVKVADICADALGFYSGSVTFDIGKQLPQLPTGEYTFTLDGAKPVKFKVEKDEVVQKP